MAAWLREGGRLVRQAVDVVEDIAEVAETVETAVLAAEHMGLPALVPPAAPEPSPEEPEVSTPPSPPASAVPQPPFVTPPAAFFLGGVNLRR